MNRVGHDRARKTRTAMRTLPSSQQHTHSPTHPQAHSRPHSRTPSPLLACLALLFTLACRAGAAESKDDLLQTQGRLLTEERRQGNVRRQLSTVVRKIDMLMLYLASNDLYREGGGEHVTGLNLKLAALNTNHVPKAESYLRLARQDAPNALSHIGNADSEVSIIVRDLDALLKEMGMTLTEDALLNQLRSIIKAEELLRRETAEWGKSFLIAPEGVAQASAKLAQAQNVVLQQVESFIPRLAESAGNETDPPRRRRFASAASALQKGRPDAALQAAAREIEAGQPINSVEQQDLALKVLYAAAEALAGQITDDVATVREVMEHLRLILKDEQQLQQEVKQANAQQFQDRHLRMQARQTDIGKDLSACNAQASKTPAAFAVRKAQDAMKEAQKELGKSRQDPAIVQQEEAITSLMVAIEALTAISALPPIALADLPEYPWQVQVLTTNSPTDDAEELLELDPTLSKKIRDMGDVVEGGGKVPTGPMPPSPPSPTQSPPPERDTHAPPPPGDSGERGKAVALSQEQINALERRNRAAVFQKYVNRLPKEFRQQVSDYYEALAE